MLSGIIIGFLRSTYPTFGRLPDAARWILMELGLLIFMAGVGLRAGGDIVTVAQYGNFELKVDFKLTPGANSGIKYYVDIKWDKPHDSFFVSARRRVCIASPRGYRQRCAFG